MTAWDEILPTQTNAGKPITQSLMERMRDNPRSVAQGDATVPYDEKINFPVAMRTSEVDSTARAAPDGTGGVRWIGGGFAGMGADGTGLGSPVASLVAGVYHFEELALGAPQTPTGMVTIFCEGDVDINDTIVSSYRVVIKASGNVTISAAVTCRGLEVRCGGDLTISAAVNAQSGVNPTIEDEDRTLVGVARFYVAGELNITSTVTANDVLMFALGDTVISDSVRAVWRLSGSAANSGVNASGWGTKDGSGQQNGSTYSSTTSGNDGSGGGGGIGGGYGGRPDGTPGSRSPGDGFRAGHRLYCILTNDFRRGGGGGSSSDEAGGDGGGRISLYVGGDLDMTGGELDAHGNPGISSGSQDSGGAGGGNVRVICAGTINDGDFHADGGDGGLADGGGGGGGGVFLAATGYTGTQLPTVVPGISSQGEPGQSGTINVDTLSADEIESLILAGVCDV